MSKFRICLSGIPIGIEAEFDSTKEFCEDYLTEEAPLFSAAVTQAEIDRMRERDRKTALAEGRTPVQYSDSCLETLALANVVLKKLIDYGVLLFHGAAMAVDGKAYLFTAKSGAGKTTHCKLWLESIPDCHILNGDKPLLLFKEGKVSACGSPWMGKEKYGVNEILPLEGICLLEQDKTNHIEEITMKDCFPVLMNQCHIPDGRCSIQKVMSRISQLSMLKLYHLGCNMEDEAALVSYHGMARKCAVGFPTPATEQKS